jgi:hypothetical protein
MIVDEKHLYLICQDRLRTDVRRKESRNEEVNATDCRITGIILGGVAGNATQNATADGLRLSALNNHIVDTPAEYHGAVGTCSPGNSHIYISAPSESLDLPLYLGPFRIDLPLHLDLFVD